MDLKTVLRLHGIGVIKAEWERTAKAPVNVQKIGNAVYGFTTEIGALRLFHRYTLTGHSDTKDFIGAEYNKPLDSWYFSMELE